MPEERTYQSVLAELQEHPELHIHIDLAGLQHCCVVNGVLDLRLIDAHSEYVFMGSHKGQRCDVVVGECACGRNHGGEPTTETTKVGRMRLFVAGHLEFGSGQVHDVTKALIQAGFSVPYDWTVEETPKLPFLEHVEHNRPIAQRMAQGLRGASAVVVCANPDLMAGLVELGFAAASGKPTYFLGAQFAAQSLFFTLPNVQLVNSTDELIELIRSDSHSGRL